MGGIGGGDGGESSSSSSSDDDGDMMDVSAADYGKGGRPGLAGYLRCRE